MLTAIETTGTISGNKGLILDDSLPFDERARVRVIVFFDQPDLEDDDDKNWLRSASNNEVFDFLADDSEDIYTIADGKPL